MTVNGVRKGDDWDNDDYNDDNNNNYTQQFNLQNGEQHNYNNETIKVTLSQATKAIREIRGIALSFFNLGTRWGR